MGHHYNPRKHLQRFRSDGEKHNCIWMYDKTTRVFTWAGISGVAAEDGFYDEDVEKALAHAIEGPSNPVVDKILSRKMLDNEERSRLTLYMLTMSTRGPRQRRKSIDQAPKCLSKVFQETRSQFQAWADENGADSELQSNRLQELNRLESQYANTTPEYVQRLIRTPFVSEQLLECLHNMFWHILPAPPGTFFITSDTPAHYFEGMGLGNPKSEFTFPLSKGIALLGEHQHSHGMAYEKPDAQLVKEVNRRILSVTERFVFSPKNEPWIDSVAQKAYPFLTSIRWN